MKKGVWIGLLVVLIIILSIIKTNVVVEENVELDVPYTVQEVKYYNYIVNETKPYGIRECKERTPRYETRFNQTYEVVNGTIYNFCRLYAKNIESKPSNFTFYAMVTFRDDGRSYDYGDQTREIKPNEEKLFIWSQKVDVKKPVTCTFRPGEIDEVEFCEYPENVYATTQTVVKKSYVVNVTKYRRDIVKKNVTKEVSLLKAIFI